MGERGNRATVSAGRPSGAALLRLGAFLCAPFRPEEKARCSAPE